MLPVDAGNALFAEVAPPDAGAKQRAELIVRAMAQMGVQVMGVGARDLSGGVEFLTTVAGRHRVTPLSANLYRGEKRLFAASQVVELHGVKVGVIGASPPTELKVPGVTARPLRETVVAEARRLRPQVDLVVVLGAVPYADALQIATDAGEAVDLVLQNHEQRGMGPGVPIPMGKAFVVHTGERGRQVARIDLELSGKGPLSDLNEAQRTRQSVQILDRQIAEVEKRIERATDPGMKKSYQATLESFRKRRADVAKAAEQKKPAGRTLALSYTTLGPELPGDPALAAEVSKLDPHSGHGH